MKKHKTATGENPAEPVRMPGASSRGPDSEGHGRVVISEEGKRKYIMNQLRANLSGAGFKKRGAGG